MLYRTNNKLKLWHDFQAHNHSFATSIHMFIFIYLLQLKHFAAKSSPWMVDFFLFLFHFEKRKKRKAAFTQYTVLFANTLILACAHVGFSL